MPVVTHADKRNVIDVRGITVTAGQTLKIRTTPNGELVLSEKCPSGETWAVTMHIEIDITN